MNFILYFCVITFKTAYSMNTTLIEIKNDIAYSFLENMERMDIIRILQGKEKRAEGKEKLSKRFAGVLHLSEQQYDEIQKQQIQMREEWDRAI